MGLLEAFGWLIFYLVVGVVALPFAIVGLGILALLLFVVIAVPVMILVEGRRPSLAPHKAAEGESYEARSR